MKNRSLSVTGVTGFLGWRIAEAFRDEGWNVRGIVRPHSRKPLPEGIDRVEAALHDVEALARAFDGCQAIVHSAALIRAPSLAHFDAVNVEGSRSVVEAANRTGARLIHISSQAAGGPGSAISPVKETDLPQPLNAYGRSKLASEAVVRTAARVPWTIVRPSAIYGPRDRGFLPLFRMAARGIFLEVAEPAAWFTLINVDDVVRSVTLSAVSERACGETFFIGHPDPHRAEDLLRHLAAVYGRRYRPLRVPAPVVRVAAFAGDVMWRFGTKPLIDRGRFAELRARGFVCDVSRVRDRLGFTAAIPLPEGLARTARWYADRGWV